MPEMISRRAFLKGSAAAACTVAASGLTAAAAPSSSSQQLCTLLDLSKCTACESCVDACQELNADKYPQPKKPFPKMYPARVPVADWSEKQDVRDRLTPYNWLYVQTAYVEADGEEIEVNIPRRCMHCINPPCVKLCPWGSARQLKSGISVIDPDICMGGSKCKAVCPWHIPERQTGVGLYLDILPSLAGNGVMYKCDRCYNRIAEGELPACIEACPEDVQQIGPRDEIIAKAHALAKEIDGYIYGETENGGTNTIYVSPVPFEAINKASEYGKGQPPLKPAADSMAAANNIVAAMAIAPIAGVAFAAGKLFKQTQKKA